MESTAVSRLAVSLGPIDDSRETDAALAFRFQSRVITEQLRLPIHNITVPLPQRYQDGAPLALRTMFREHISSTAPPTIPAGPPQSFDRISDRVAMARNLRNPSLPGDHSRLDEDDLASSSGVSSPIEPQTPVAEPVAMAVGGDESKVEDLNLPESQQLDLD